MISDPTRNETRSGSAASSYDHFTHSQPGEPPMSTNSVNRRTFLAGTAAAGAAMTLPGRQLRPHLRTPTRSSASASSASAAAASSTSTSSSRCRRKARRSQPVAVCDVWDGDRSSSATIKGRGLYPSAKRCGLKHDDKEHVTKDYRKILDQKDVDVVVHRHAGPLARHAWPSTPWRPARTSTARSR